MPSSERISSGRAGAFKRSGLHRVACQVCGTYVYATVAQLEAHGMPVCPVCREPYEPERLELAMLLDADDSAVMVAYRAKCSSVAHGQAWTGRRGQSMEQPEMRAFAQITREQRRASRARRIGALAPTPEPMPF